MPHKLRKVRKLRGSRTHGWGRVGQHRKTGTKGMRKASFDKGGWTYIIKYMPDYFGKKGFTSPKSLRSSINTINLIEMEHLAEKLAKEDKLEVKDGKIYIDLQSLGYDKLLGRGKVTKPYIIKVPAFSETAVRKVEEAGGKIIGA